MDNGKYPKECPNESQELDDDATAVSCHDCQDQRLLAAPVFVPGPALGKDRSVAASERITVGGIGINSRGVYVLRSMLSQPDVQFLATCDVRADRRKAIKDMADRKYGNKDLRHVSRLS